METNNREKIQAIKTKYNTGLITYDEMLALAQPIIDDINKQGKEVAKKYGKKFNNLKLNYILR